MNPYQTLLNAVLEMEKDFEKFYDKGNAAAGTRVRQVSIAPLFAHAIRSICEETSISRLFE